MVEALLDVAAYPDDSIAAISFNFWHNLASCLGMRGFSPVDETERERRRAVCPLAHCLSLNRTSWQPLSMEHWPSPFADPCLRVYDWRRLS